MKMNYITPAVEVIETVAEQMMALSLQQGEADPTKPILVEEETEFNIWED